MAILKSILPIGATVELPDRLDCPVCDDLFKPRGFVNHLNRCLRAHEMTFEEYEEKHQNHLYSPAHRFAIKCFQISDFSITEFGLMKYAGLDWCHISANKPKPWYQQQFGRKPETLPLLKIKNGKTDLRHSFYHFKKHLQGELTLGIWPKMDNRFCVIDLDDEQVQYKDDLVDRLVDLQLSFQIVFSGKKGYHFWIAWNRTVPHDELVALHDFLCDGIPHDHQVWPYKKSLIKVPLGLHRGTKHLACLVDANGEPFALDQQFDAFLNMKDNHIPPAFYRWHNQTNVPVHRISAKSDSVQKSKDRTREMVTAEALDRCLTQNFKLDDGRHRTLFFLAVHLKDNRKLSQDETQEQLDGWSLAVPSNHPPHERLRDAHSTVKRVFERDMSFHGVALAPLSEHEQSLLKERCCVCVISVLGSVGSDVRKEDRTRRLKSAQKVAIAMASIAKASGGPIRVGHRKLAQLAGVSKGAVDRAMPLLVEDLVVVSDDPDKYDQILANVDKRTRRRGGLFVCLERGSFPSYRKSLYRLEKSLCERLCWQDKTMFHHDAVGGSLPVEFESRASEVTCALT
jgi:hypothetical protein